MATADEILAMAEGEGAEVESSVLVIDKDLRTINIPSTVSLLGVESDEDVRRLHFSMPRYYGEFDLSEFSIHVNYANAKGDIDTYLVTDAAVVDDTIKFSWLVGRNAVRYKGKVQFIVCLKRTEAGEVVQEYNTTVATLPVLEGLEAEISEDEEKRLRDIVTQLLESIEQSVPKAVNDWLDEHPEATTTVQDASLGVEKLIVGTLGYVTPEMFGAVGDGIADDTAAVQAALSVGAAVVLTGVYGVSAGLTVKASSVVGLDAKIVLLDDVDVVLTLPAQFSIEGVEIDCDDKAVCRVLYSEENANFTAKRLSVHNIRLSRQSEWGAIGIDVAGGTIVMDDITMHDIYALKNGVIGDSYGAAYGIRAGGYDYCELSTLVMHDFHSVDDAGSIVFEDGGAVYVTGNKAGSNTVINGANIVNPGKYGIKSQTYNVCISHVDIYNSEAGHKDGIVLLPAGGADYDVKAVVSNCFFREARPECPEETTACVENQVFAKIENCCFDTLCGVAVSNSGEIHVTNCDITGCGIVGLKNSTVANTRMRGSLALVDFNASSFCHVHGCRIEYLKYGVSPYPNYSHLLFASNAVLDGCVFVLGKYNSFSLHGSSNTMICNSSFFGNGGSYAYLRIPANTVAKVFDCRFDVSEARDCYVGVYGTAEFLRCASTGEKQLIDVYSGTAKIGGMSLSHVHYRAGEIKNTPFYEEALPTGSYPDGVFALLLTDGLLYRRNGSEWAAVSVST